MHRNLYPGKFIVLEGLDGSGQSTQVKHLGDFLIENGYNVILTKEPTKDSKVSAKIREILDKNTGVQPRQFQELFAEDRKEHLEKLIIPALKDGKIVVSDRYFFSSLAYGSASGVDLEELIKLNNDFLLPDSTIILEVSPEVCMDRIGKRGEPQTLFEEKEKLSKVWETYKILPQRFDGIVVIDGQKSIQEVHDDIKMILQDKLNIGTL